MNHACARGLSFLIAVLFLSSFVLGQQREKKMPVVTPPRIECETDNCVSKVLYLPNFSTGIELQNLVNAFRVIADITSLYANPSEHTISLKGTPEQVAIAEKLVSVLESLRPGGHSSSSVLVYQPTASLSNGAVSEKAPVQLPASRIPCQLTSCVIKVLYLPNFATLSEIQDVVNMLRTIADILAIVPDPTRHTIAFKGNPEQIAIAERLVSILEGLRSSGGQNRSSVLVYELKGSMPAPTESEEARQRALRTVCEVTSCFIKVLYLPDLSITQLQDVVNRMRTTTGIPRIMPLSPPSHVIVLRGTAEQVARAETLANE